MPAEAYVGLMSGTSLDGVDAVLVECSEARIDCLATHFLPYPESIRAALLELQLDGRDELHRAAQLSSRLADLYADAVIALLKAAPSHRRHICAIGCHGQTVRHAPAAGYSLQLNNPARLVEKTGLTVVADFRSRDIAAGGQGAPLVPAFHDVMFRSPTDHRVIVNIGGISNLTDLAPGQPVRGFDCGPGNMLLDAWTLRHLGTNYDECGHWAKQGHSRPALMAALRSHPFLAEEPPKSCGREEFGIEWLDAQIDAGRFDASPPDVQATLVDLTATAIADAIRLWCGTPSEIYVCGGGAHNAALMGALSIAIPTAALQTTDALGLPADWVEAVAFAWLAYRTLHNLPGNLPAVTGAAGTRVLGAIYPA